MKESDIYEKVVYCFYCGKEKTERTEVTFKEETLWKHGVFLFSFYEKGVKSYVALYVYRAFGCGIGLGRV